MPTFSQNGATVSAPQHVDAEPAIRYVAFLEAPIVCTLTEAELRERRTTILDSICETALSVTALPLGYAWRFQPGSEILAQLGRLMELEERCCPFLSFRLAVESGDQSICLEITVPPEARIIIAELFGR